jgi:hypothetical protein
MGRNRFVKPRTVTLSLSDGDWIEIKKELNAGEERRIFGRLVKEMRAGEKAMIDPEQIGLTKLAEYIVAWSFTNETGKPVEVSESAMNALDADSYVELVQAIDKYEESQEAEKAARKNDPAMSMASAAT